MPIIELRHVRKSYRDPGSGAKVPVLQDVSLNIDPGESVAIVGPSGCGKSTLLNIMGTLDEPDEGEVIFEGESLKGASPARISAIRSGKIGFIFQLHHLLPQCTVLENVLLPTLALEMKPDGAESASRARELLEMVGLENRAGYKPAQLSGGERQRVAVVRALINRPRLVLADEPTGSLDESNASKLTEILLNLVGNFDISLVLVTHQHVQAEKMNKIFTLHDGKVV